jgi:hypothetical protein
MVPYGYFSYSFDVEVPIYDAGDSKQPVATVTFESVALDV